MIMVVWSDRSLGCGTVLPESYLDVAPVVVPVADITEALVFYAGWLSFVVMRQRDWPLRVQVRPSGGRGQAIELVAVSAWHFQPQVVQILGRRTETVVDPFGNLLLFAVTSQNDSR